MSSKEVYKLLIFSGVHLKVRESKKGLVTTKDRKYLFSIGRTSQNALDVLPKFVGILNKKQILNEVVDSYISKMQVELKDEAFSSFVIEQLKNSEKEDKKEFLKGIVWLAHSNDRRVSQGELDVLSHLFNKLGAKISDFDATIKKIIDSYSKEAKKIKKTYGKSRPHPLLVTATIMLVCSIAAGIYVYMAYANQANQPLKRKLSNISYKKIHFDRYVAAGNYRGGERSDQTGKLVVFYIKGSADIEFDLSNLRLVKTTGGYSAIYSNSEARSMGFSRTIPFIVDVNVDQKDVTEILNDTPEELTENQIKTAAVLVGGIAAVSGGYVGAKVGAGIGNAINPGIGAIFGAGGGAVIGSTTAGIGSYVMMKNYLTGMRITDAITQSSKEEIIEKSKSLIAAEILLDKNLEKELTKDFEHYVKSFYKNIGINVKNIDYKTNV